MAAVVILTVKKNSMNLAESTPDARSFVHVGRSDDERV